MNLYFFSDDNISQKEKKDNQKFQNEVCLKLIQLNLDKHEDKQFQIFFEIDKINENTVQNTILKFQYFFFQKNDELTKNHE